MRQNAPTDRLEDLFITIHRSRLVPVIDTSRERIADFNVHLRYGTAPCFQEEDGIIAVDNLELIFSRRQRKRQLFLPVAFKPLLALELKDLGDLGILRAIKTIDLPERDSKLFGILMRFTQLSYVHIESCGQKLAIRIRYGQVESATAFLNATQTQWLLDT